MAKYFFNQKYKNEMDAFAKYFNDIQRNGFIQSIKKNIDNMRDPCDLFPEASGQFFTHQLNVYHGKLEHSKRNPEIMCASKDLKLRVTKSKGRHLVSTKAISKHKVIIVDQPTVLQVRPACLCYGEQITGIYRCHECGMSCRLFFICDSCNIVIFCTKACRRKAMIYHRYECYGFQRHFWSMETTDYSYIAFRMMLYGASKQFMTKGDPLKYGDEDNNYPTIFKLKSNFRNLPLVKLNEILRTSARSLLYLINYTDFFELFEECNKVELYNYIGGLLVKHYCQAQINNMLLTFTNLHNGYGFDVPVGFGKAICPTIALLNHSCTPNSVVMPSMNTVVVKSVKRIKEGEEVTICYSEITNYLNLDERQLISQELFNFSCTCSFCEFESDMLEAPFKCIQCGVGLITEIPSDSEEPMGQCLHCLSRHSIRKQKLFLHSSQIYRSMYWNDRSMINLKQIAYCLKEVFPRRSIYMLDIYREMFNKFNELKVHPTETMKYGLLAFNVMTTYVANTNVRYLASKLNFFISIIQSEEFDNITCLTEEEQESMGTFLFEAVKTNKDLLFYVPASRAVFFKKLVDKLDAKYKGVTIK